MPTLTQSLKSIAGSLGALSTKLHNEVVAEEVRISMILLAKFPDPATRPRLRYETLRSDYWAPKEATPEAPNSYDTPAARYFRGNTSLRGAEQSKKQK